ncbi:MAG: Hpt domain-containing protein [bacterium]
MDDTGFDIPQAAAHLEISPELYKRLARLFLEDTKTQMSNLEAAIEREDSDQVARIAHHVAGSAENLELFVLGNAARRIMSEANSRGTTGSVHRQYGELREIFSDFQRKLQPYL